MKIGDQHGLLVHDGAAVSTTACSTSAARAARATFPAGTCSRSTRRPARCSGTSTRFRRTRRIRAGTSPGPTWVGGERNGGGIWETAAIDPELGLLYMAVGNPFGDSTKRAGTNLFTDSIIALTLETGRLKWYFQQTHHDVWDYDSGAPPILFDMQVGGRRVQGGGRGEQERLALHPESRDRKAGASDQGDAGADRRSAARRAAVADAADSVHGERASRWSRCARWSRSTFPPEQLAKSKAVPIFTPPRPEPDHRARHRRRHQLQPDCRTARRPGCST